MSESYLTMCKRMEKKLGFDGIDESEFKHWDLDDQEDYYLWLRDTMDGPKGPMENTDF